MKLSDSELTPGAQEPSSWAQPTHKSMGNNFWCKPLRFEIVLFVYWGITNYLQGHKWFASPLIFQVFKYIMGQRLITYAVPMLVACSWQPLLCPPVQYLFQFSLEVSHLFLYSQECSLSRTQTNAVVFHWLLQNFWFSFLALTTMIITFIIICLMYVSF